MPDVRKLLFAGKAEAGLTQRVRCLFPVCYTALTMSKQPHTITISGELAFELEEWGKLTAKLFGKLRRRADMKGDKGKITIPNLRSPKQTPEEQAWFWTEAWQQGEREVNAALIKGEYDTFESVEELIEDLHRHV